MTDVSTKPTPAGLPLPEPCKTVSVYADHGPTLRMPCEDYFDAADLHAYAAAKTAELQAKVTRYEESTRLAEAHLTLTLTQLAEAQAECARLRERLDTASSANSELYGACSRQVKNIEAWLETGEPAGPDESKSIYEQLCKAIDRCPMDIDAALRGKETE